jgi:adenylate kinase
LILILLGAPGAGKGTQSKVLCDRYGLKHLATGDIFRGEIAAKTELGVKAADYVKTGKLVPDHLVTEMVAGKLEAGGNYLLDGFPRNLEQAQSLDQILKANKQGIDLVVLLGLPQNVAMKRLTSRRVCSKCAEVYNVLTKPPLSEGACDKCGGKVEQREDDSEATAQKRLMVFEDITQPLAAYYKGEQVFEEVDASRSPDEVTASLCALIEKKTAEAGKA